MRSNSGINLSGGKGTGINGDQGIPGIQGVTGIGTKGDTGDVGASIKGDKGDQGEQGKQGRAGRPGPQGPQGPPGIDHDPYVVIPLDCEPIVVANVVDGTIAFTMTVLDNCTINIVDGKQGQLVTFVFEGDAQSNRTVTWGDGFHQGLSIAKVTKGGIYVQRFILTGNAWKPASQAFHMMEPQ